MSASRNEARRLSGNQYFTWHAPPRFQNRFSFPPDFRRLSGGSADPKPVADRPVAGRSAGGIAADHPPAHPFHMPGNFLAFARQFLGRLPAPARQSSRSLLLTRRRPSVRATGANTGSPSGNSLNVFPAYARP